MDAHQPTATAPAHSSTAGTQDVKSSVPITIKVRTIEGQSADFVVLPSDKVRHLKSLISASSIAPSVSVSTPLVGPSSPSPTSPTLALHKQRLIFATREMADDEEVGSYGVVDGSRVSLTLNLLPGETAVRSPAPSAAAPLPISDAMDVDTDAAAPQAAIATTVQVPAVEVAPKAASGKVGGGKKKRCEGPEGVVCKNLAQRLTGECDDCGGKFCSTHRLPEDHKCVALSKRLADEHAANAKRLVANKLETNKLIDRTRS